MCCKQCMFHITLAVRSTNILFKSLVTGPAHNMPLHSIPARYLCSFQRELHLRFLLCTKNDPLLTNSKMK